MPESSDVKLLSLWRDRRDRDAMDQLIRRHIHFVYGAARRMLRDPVWAEDVTQAVFLLLIQKSPRLTSDRALAIWLHRTTRYACANACRLSSRRDRREQIASRPDYVAATDQAAAADEHALLLPLLDDAMDQLNARDRSGVILCYFQQRSYREIGSSMGISEDAARKRISRAIDRMREFFASRGVAAGSVSLSSCLACECVKTAPPALALSATKLAGASQIASLAYPSAQIAQKVVDAMFLWKMKLAAAACAAIVLGGAVTGATIHQVAGLATTHLVTTSTNSALAAAPFEVKASDATTVQFLGVAKWGAAPADWFALDGSKIDDPRGPFSGENMRARPGTTHQAVLHVAGHDLAGGYSVNVPQATETRLYDLTPDADRAFLLVPFAVPQGQSTVDIELLLAEGDWKTIGTGENEPGHGLGDFDTEYGSVALTHLIENPGRGSMLYVAYDIKGPQIEVFAVDGSGTEHRAFNINTGDRGKFRTMRLEYDLAPDAIASVNVKVRPYNRRILARNVTLDPTKPTKPTIEVTDIKPPEVDKSK